MDFEFIPTVQAQELDSVAQPTFGPLNVEGGGTTSESVQILLSADNSTVAVGETFTVSVELNTGDNISISEYQISLLYDPLKLSVVDQDPSTAGVQVNFTDTIFSLAEPTEDNNFASSTSGIIFLKATTEFPVTVNREVFEIRFQAQSGGSADIQIDTTPIDGTRLRRETTDIPYTDSSVSLTVDSAAISCNSTEDCPDGQSCLSNNICGIPTTECSTDSDCGTSEECQDGVCQFVCTADLDCPAGYFCAAGECRAETTPLPDTALVDDLGPVGTVVLALALISFGLFLRRKPQHE